MQERLRVEPEKSAETGLTRIARRNHSSLQDCLLARAVCSRLLLPWAPFRAPRRPLEEMLVVLSELCKVP